MRLAEMRSTLLLFDDVHRAERCADVLRQLRQQKHIRIGGAALLHHDANGGLHIDEFDDMTAVQGIVGGMALGAVVGMFTAFTVIEAALVAAVAGGLIGHFVDRGINDHDLELAGQQVPPGMSGLLLIALPEHLDLARGACQGQIAEMTLVPSLGLTLPASPTGPSASTTQRPANTPPSGPQPTPPETHA